jgi:energy-coupling factor transporter ATP-binding protein EcfA2
MKPTATIRLLTDLKSKNDKGDFFTSLISDLFHAQGYDKVYHDLGQPGREIDIQSEHRHEFKSVAIECKAHKAKMGGDDVNKFRGVVDGEREKLKKEKIGKKIVAYFISLGGFTTTAIAQEDARRKHKRIIFWDSPTIIKELERCHMLPTDAEVAERAGQCAHYAGLSGAVIDEIELLAHQDLSYIKAVIYSQNGARTHFALIQTGGVALADGPAQLIISCDKKNGGTLHTLKYLSPAPIAPDRQELEQQAKSKYQEWIDAECGSIHLDGLPAEADYSTKSLRLERLFVPLRAIIDKESPRAEDKKFTSSKREAYRSEPMSYPISELLTAGTRLALLAAPGGGKSTLLKRLATAYTSEDRRAEIEDGLPSHDWLPLFVRCRELRVKATYPIMDILDEIPAQTSMQPDEAIVFRSIMREALQTGKVLLLVDGLDEIPDEADRKIFAKNLRTFLSTRKLITAVVTSREAGFRAVAGVLAEACRHARLASLQESDIVHLCTQWHIEVAGIDLPKVREEAQRLTQDIFANNSIHTLARNPLLLTTLLVVKRSIGELPRNRAGLYEEAVRLLVKTWNVEGYGFNLAALTERQALAQLSYVACTMLEAGIKQITQSALYILLHKAKEVLAEELHYITVSPEDFIEQVERRSSLLISVGKTKVGGTLETVYEFRHLTFQEYLAARGYVKEQHARRPDEPRLVDILSPNFTNENWAEVIPLAAVLAEHKANAIIQELLATCDAWNILDAKEKKGFDDPHFVLAQCIVDEVLILPKTMTAALEKIASYDDEFNDNYLMQILRGKAGGEFKQIIEDNYFESTLNFELFLDGMRTIALKYLTEKDKIFSELLQDASEVDFILTELRCSDIRRQVAAAMQIAAIGHELYPGNIDDWRTFLSENQAQQLRAELNSLLISGSLPAAYAVGWALAWSGGNAQVLGIITPKPEEIVYLFKFVVTEKEVPYFVFSWALSEQPLLERDALLKNGFDISPYIDFMRKSYRSENFNRGIHFKECIVLLAWYCRKPWSDDELIRMIDDVYKQKVNVPYYGISDEKKFIRAKALLSELGDGGKLMQKEREKKKELWLELVRKDEEDMDLPF